MFGNKKEEDKISKPERLLNQYGLSDLKVMAYKLLLFTGGTVQQITNSLLVDLLKSNLMIIRQNDKIIKLLEERR